jgi:hypothetical protein
MRFGVQRSGFKGGSEFEAWGSRFKVVRGSTPNLDPCTSNLEPGTILEL